ncbi:MAG TPA: hypothetical protein VFG62_14450 [Rhodopila sp.]|jgi:hypothetical protein|nr:hypothetical protein [Rhodopila sp.]
MWEVSISLAVFVLLCASAALGRYVRPRLPEAHRARETMETMHLMIGMLVTFAALVLGLLTASVKSSFDRAVFERRDYALQLTQMDQCLRNLGPMGDEPRRLIKEYTAAIIASTWPNEPHPTGVDYPDTSRMPLTGASPALEALLNRADVLLHTAQPTEPALKGLLQDCITDEHSLLAARRTVIESVGTRLSRPFLGVLVFWLMVVFSAFGLVAPRNTLSLLGILLCAVSLSTVMFIIADLSEPYSGFFSISSEYMRNALASMMHPT